MNPHDNAWTERSDTTKLGESVDDESTYRYRGLRKDRHDSVEVQERNTNLLDTVQGIQIAIASARPRPKSTRFARRVIPDAISDTRNTTEITAELTE